MNKSQLTCADMPFEDLNVSKACLEGMKRSGFATVGELIDFLEQTWGKGGNPGGLNSKFVRNIPGLVNRLKAIDCWPDDLEDVEIPQ